MIILAESVFLQERIIFIKINKTKEFPTKANAKSSKYYLKAEKAMDWYTVKIEGTISN